MGIQDDRSKLFGSKLYTGPRHPLVLEGVELEIRAPKAKYAFLASKTGRTALDFEELILTCVYHKEEQKPFFEKEHLELLKESSAHADGILNQLTSAIEKVIAEQMAASTEADEKNS
jgi:hypothetical protein